MLDEITIATAKQRRIKEAHKYDAQVPELEFENDGALEPVIF